MTVLVLGGENMMTSPDRGLVTRKTDLGVGPGPQATPGIGVGNAPPVEIVQGRDPMLHQVLQPAWEMGTPYIGLR